MADVIKVGTFVI